MVYVDGTRRGELFFGPFDAICVRLRLPCFGVEVVGVCMWVLVCVSVWVCYSSLF